MPVWTCISRTTFTRVTEDWPASLTDRCPLLLFLEIDLWPGCATLVHGVWGADGVRRAHEGVHVQAYRGAQADYPCEQGCLPIHGCGLIEGVPEGARRLHGRPERGLEPRISKAT